MIVVAIFKCVLYSSPITVTPTCVVQRKGIPISSLKMFHNASNSVAYDCNAVSIYSLFFIDLLT